MTNIAQKEIKMIAIYARVSTSSQENEGTIETQLSAVKEFVQKHNYTVVQEYLDNGWSGDSLVRPALDQLRMDAKKRIWEGVLIYDPDRLARRYSYQELVMDELREAGAEVMFVTTSAPKNEEDKILYGVKGLFAQYERAKISERFRLGKKRKVEEGHLLVSKPLYGYKYIANNKETKTHGYYEINQTEARVVKMIFGWVADEGLTLRKVVKRLQELGIKPRESKRGVWSTSTLTTILRNRAYVGEAHWGSSYAVVPENPTNTEKYRKTKKSSRRIKPEEEWIASKIPVPPIIDKELFERVRTQLKKNFALCQRNKKNEYLLAGKIRCICGRTRAGEGAQQGKHLYYRCSDRVLSFPLPPTCSEGGINARIADKLVWDKIAGLMSSSDLLQTQLDRWTNVRQNKSVLSVGDTKAIEKEIVKLKDQEGRYNKGYGAGLFSIDQLKEYTAPIKEQIGSLGSQLIKAKQQESQVSTTALPSEDEIKSFAQESVEVLLDLSFEKKRVIVTDVVDKVVATQQQLQVSGYIPLTLNHVGYKPIHRYSRSSECW
jgi:site-specific DNA recombinase